MKVNSCMKKISVTDQLKKDKKLFETTAINHKAIKAKGGIFHAIKHVETGDFVKDFMILGKEDITYTKNGVSHAKYAYLVRTHEDNPAIIHYVGLNITKDFKQAKIVSEQYIRTGYGTDIQNAARQGIVELIELKSSVIVQLP